MSELRELYQQVILDHNKNPRNFGALEGANRVQEGYNPLCGDQLHVYLLVSDEGLIEDIQFKGSGCAISKASASIMTETLKGKTESEAQEIFSCFHEVVTSDVDAPVDADGIGKMAVFAGVREFPMRVKCATLAWHTMSSALKRGEDAISTE